MVGTGILSNNMRLPPPTVTRHSGWWPSLLNHQWHHPLIWHYTNFWPFYRSGPYYRILRFTLLREVSIEHLQRALHANRGRLLLQTPGSAPLWDLQGFLCWDKYIPNLSCFRTFEFRTSWYFCFPLFSLLSSVIDIISVQDCKFTQS